MALKPGKFLARIVEYGVSKPKDGKRPSIFVKFQIDDSNDTIFYWGQMSDKSNPASKKHPYEITIQNLLLMGLKGSDPYAVAENAPGALNVFQPYELVLETNEYQGKTSIRVKYINLPGGGVKEELNSMEAKEMAGFNFAGAVMAARQELNIKEPAANVPDEDIPF